jgi:hypothetical protein
MRATACALLFGCLACSSAVQPDAGCTARAVHDGGLAYLDGGRIFAGSECVAVLPDCTTLTLDAGESCAYRLSGALNQRYSCGVYIFSSAQLGDAGTPPAGFSDLYVAALEDGGPVVGTWANVELSTIYAEVLSGTYDTNHVGGADFFAGDSSGRADAGPAWNAQVSGIRNAPVVVQGVFELQLASAGTATTFGYQNSEQFFTHAQGTVAAELLPAEGSSSTGTVDVCIRFTDSLPSRAGLGQPGGADAN